LIQQHPELQSNIEIHLAGKTDTVILQDLEDLASMIKLRGYISHKDALMLMRQAHLLLLPLNEISSANTIGRIPGKLFEYIAMDKPILMLGNKDSDAGKIIAELGDSWCIDNSDDESVFRILHDMILNSKGERAKRNVDVMRFERRKLTGDLAVVLNQFVNTEALSPRKAQINV
jgi:hypothetical protein